MVQRAVLLVVSWAALAASEIVFSLSVSGSVLHEARLPLSLRLAIFGLDLATLGIALVLLLGPALALALPSPSRSVRRLALLVITWMLLAAYLASWGLFRSTGSFLGLDAASMFANDTVQMLQHIAQLEPLRLLLLPLVSLGLAFAFVFLSPRWTATMTARLEGRIIRVAGCLFLLLVATGLAGTWVGSHMTRHVRDPSSGSWLTISQLQAEARDTRTGPLPTLIADVLRAEKQIPPQQGSIGNFSVERRPLITLEDWSSAVDTATMHPWNVLIILVESLRCDQLAACGAEREVLPEVERIAREGRVFINNRTQASMSSYADPCPLSSQYPLRENITHFYPKNPTYPRVLIYDLLSHLGWHTAIFSSQNENWGKMLNYLDTGSLDLILHSETYEGETYVPHDDGFFSNWVQGERRAGKIDDRFTVDAAIDWIDDTDGEPFFIYMNMQNSHVPFVVPADFPHQFGPDRIDFPLTFGSFPKDKKDEVVGRYADSLAYVDAQLGRLFAYLKRSGQWDRTLVVITGDTGQAFYEHGFAGHANELYDEVMRVPLVIRAPGLESSVDDFPSQHVDVPPTLLHLLGLPPHPGHQGVDLLDPHRDASRSVYLLVQTQHAHQYAIVRDGWKLIWDTPGQRVLLYDLKEDPTESHDLSAEREDIGRPLADRLLAWQTLQLQYYADTDRHSREYPPVLLE